MGKALFRAVAGGLVVGLVGVFYAAPARAFVPIPVGGHPGELDLSLQLGIEAGKIEPNENADSWQRAHDFRLYGLSAGYTFGDLGVFQDLSLRVEGIYYTSPAERSDRTIAGRALDPARCVAPARLDGGACEFHAADDGALASVSISTNLVHKADFSFGVFLRGTAAIGLETTKFASPSVHYLAAGVSLGIHLTPWLGFQSLTFIGLGTRPFSDDQNGAVALNNLLVFEASRWLLPWRAGVKIGPYVELDLNERFDQVYDAAYSGSAPDGSARVDRIRAARFALSFLPYMLITERVSVEAGYVQKLFGYDARATQYYYLGVRGLFDLRR
jgi:hypothetical protein